MQDSREKWAYLEDIANIEILICHIFLDVSYVPKRSEKYMIEEKRAASGP